jgi:50S ribosomal subunit-associated GTPase HflX
MMEETMARSTLFDRLNHELEAFGKKAQSALDEGKLQIELLRLRRRQDNAARDLGLLIHRRERGGEAEPRRIDALLLRLDDLERDVARLERQISETRRRRSSNVPQTGSTTTPEPPPAEAGASPTGG